MSPAVDPASAVEDSAVANPPAEPVGIKEIAARLGVKPQTVQNWRSGGRFPAPRWTVGGGPAWCWRLDVAPWALDTGRLVVGRGTWQRDMAADGDWIMTQLLSEARYDLDGEWPLTMWVAVPEGPEETRRDQALAEISRRTHAGPERIRVLDLGRPSWIGPDPASPRSSWLDRIALARGLPATGWVRGSDAVELERLAPILDAWRGGIGAAAADGHHLAHLELLAAKASRAMSDGDPCRVADALCDYPAELILARVWPVVECEASVEVEVDDGLSPFRFGTEIGSDTPPTRLFHWEPAGCYRVVQSPPALTAEQALTAWLREGCRAPGRYRAALYTSPIPNFGADAEAHGAWDGAALTLEVQP